MYTGNSVLLLERNWAGFKIGWDTRTCVLLDILSIVARGDLLATSKAKDLLQIKFETPEMELIITANWWFPHKCFTKLKK